MARMIPIDMVNAFRNSVNVAIDNWGVPVTLFILANSDAIEDKDVYTSVEDRQYKLVYANCRLEWVDNVYKMKKLGLYNEKYLPIIAWFRMDMEIPLHSYFTVEVTYLPSNQRETDKFEIVDDSIEGLANIELMQCYKVAPLRSQTTTSNVGL